MSNHIVPEINSPATERVSHSDGEEEINLEMIPRSEVYVNPKLLPEVKEEDTATEESRQFQRFSDEGNIIPAFIKKEEPISNKSGTPLQESSLLDANLLDTEKIERQLDRNPFNFGANSKFKTVDHQIQEFPQAPQKPLSQSVFQTQSIKSPVFPTHNRSVVSPSKQETVHYTTTTYVREQPARQVNVVTSSNQIRYQSPQNVVRSVVITNPVPAQCVTRSTISPAKESRNVQYQGMSQSTFTGNAQSQSFAGGSRTYYPMNNTQITKRNIYIGSHQLSSKGISKPISVRQIVFTSGAGEEEDKQGEKDQNWALNTQPQVSQNNYVSQNFQKNQVQQSNQTQQSQFSNQVQQIQQSLMVQQSQPSHSRQESVKAQQEVLNCIELKHEIPRPFEVEKICKMVVSDEAGAKESCSPESEKSGMRLEKLLEPVIVQEKEQVVIEQSPGYQELLLKLQSMTEERNHYKSEYENSKNELHKAGDTNQELVNHIASIKSTFKKQISELKSQISKAEEDKKKLAKSEQIISDLEITKIVRI